MEGELNMTTQYDYNNVIGTDIIAKVTTGVKDSSMTNKSIEYGNYDSGTQELQLFFTDALDPDDKTVLDGIVANPPTPSPETDVVLTSSNGSKWRIIVDDYGVLSTEETQ